tara:strand:- start:612 stop:899 length:288 start_codon:yes stop_codon:yes gene_type:complete
MVKFIKVNVNSAHEYFNVSSVIGVRKNLTGFASQAIILYETTKSPAYTLLAFEGGSTIGDYIIEAVMNANSSSHTSNVYYPEITQGTQPSVANIT